MPFCSQCGNAVEATDVFCARCGSRQPAASSRRPNSLSGMNSRTAAILCYVPIVGWIAAIIVLASEKFRHDRPVRFHAFQGLYLFVAWLLVHEVIRPMFEPLPGPNYIGKLLQIGVLCVWIFMLIKAGNDEPYSLPVIGELAERSVSEKA
jgi:uncharacterized membrane protein